MIRKLKTMLAAVLLLPFCAVTTFAATTIEYTTDMHGNKWGYTLKNKQATIVSCALDQRYLADFNYDVGVPATCGGCKVVALGERVFANQNVKSVKMTSDVKQIGESCFTGCRLLVYVGLANNNAPGPCKFPSGLKTFGENCFYNCPNLLLTDSDRAKLVKSFAFGSYTVTWNANAAGATVSPSTSEFGIGSTKSAVSKEAPTPKRTGYKFDGWYLDSLLTQPLKDTKTQNEVIDRNTTCYAKWTATSKFTVTWNANGGTVSPKTSSFPYGTTKSQISSEAPTPKRTGYTFGGWYLDAALTQALSTALTKNEIVEKNMTVYAKWTGSSTFTVTWNANGGTVSPSTSSFTYGTTLSQISKAAPTPTRTDYTFGGWYLNSALSKALDASASKSDVLDKDTTIYAKWTAKPTPGPDPEPDPNKFTVTWNAMGGTVSPKTSSFAYGTKVSAILKAAPKPTRTGYTFGGWYWDEAYTDPLNAAESQAATVDYDATFYAKWTGGAAEKHSVTVTYDETKGKVTGAGEYAKGKSFTLKATAKKGYVFGGWYLDGEYTQQAYSLLNGNYLDAKQTRAMGESDLELYAKFISTDEDKAFVDFTVEDEYETGKKIEWIAVKLSGCTSTPTVKVTGLPKGLKYDVLRILGTPTKSGVYTVAVTVTTAGGATATKSAVVVVRNPNEKVVKLTVDDVDGVTPGTVKGAGVYSAGKSVTLTATANKGYVFSGWYKGTTLLSRLASYKITVKDDVEYTAKFIPVDRDKASVGFAVAEEYATGEEIKAITVNVACSSVCTLKVTGLPTGLKVAEQRTSSSVSPSYSIYGTPTKSGVYPIVVTVTTAGKNTVSKSAVIVVRKPGEFVVKATVADLDGAVPGTVKGAGIYASGSKVTLTATPNKGYAFGGWYTDSAYTLPVSGNYLATTYSLTMPRSDVKRYARFVSIADDAASVDFSSEAEYTTGAEIEPIAVDVSGCKSTPTVKVTGLPTGLKFDAKTNVISGKPTKSGVYTVAVTVTTLSKKTDSKTAIIVVREEGEKVVKVGTKLSDGAGGAFIESALAGTVKGAGVYNPGKPVTLTATASKGYVFIGWHLGGEFVSQAASYKFDMKVDDVLLDAVFVSAATDKRKIALQVNGCAMSVGSALETNLFCGVSVNWPIAATALSDTTVKVTGLPAGLKLVQDKASGQYSITGVPTAVKETVAKFTVTTVGKSSQVFEALISVDPLPTWATGTFIGVIRQRDYDVNGEVIVDAVSGEVHDWCDIRTTMTIDGKGKITLKAELPSGPVYTQTFAGFTEISDGMFVVEGDCTCSDEKFHVRYEVGARPFFDDEEYGVLLGCATVSMQEYQHSENKKWVDRHEVTLTTDEAHPLVQNIWLRTDISTSTFGEFLVNKTIVVEIPSAKGDGNDVIKFTFSRSSSSGMRAVVMRTSSETQKTSNCGSIPLLLTCQAEGVYHGELVPRIEGYAIVFDVTIKGRSVSVSIADSK